MFTERIICIEIIHTLSLKEVRGHQPQNMCDNHTMGLFAGGVLSVSAVFFSFCKNGESMVV